MDVSGLGKTFPCSWQAGRQVLADCPRIVRGSVRGVARRGDAPRGVSILGAEKWPWVQRLRPSAKVAYHQAMKTIEALYEDGLLKPDTPLALRPGERVRLIVVRRPDPRRWDLDRLVKGADEDLALTEQGLADWSDALDAEDRS